MNKEDRKIVFVVLIIIIFLLLLQQYMIRSSPKEESILLEEIKRVELKIDSLNNVKDSIRTAIDSTHVKIITNEKHHKEIINNIVFWTDSANREYIDSYIGRYIESHKSYFYRTQ